MAYSKRPSPVKLILGTIASSEGVLLEAEVSLVKKFGPIDFQSKLMPFHHTKYYEREMGPDLLRQFFSFRKLINPRKLAAIKLYTNRLERHLSCKKDKFSRKINLDPGYISASKLVLATAKDYTHRIYLRSGIYGEVTLYFRDGSFRPWDWTYPDYKTKDYIEIFNEIRRIYLVRPKK